MARLEGLEPPTYRFEVGYYREMNNLDALLLTYTMGYVVADYAATNGFPAPVYHSIPERTGHGWWSQTFRVE
jgi:hypothetical protein